MKLGEKVEEINVRLIANETSLPMSKEQQLETEKRQKEIIYHPRLH